MVPRGIPGNVCVLSHFRTEVLQDCGLSPWDIKRRHLPGMFVSIFIIFNYVYLSVCKWTHAWEYRCRTRSEVSDPQQVESRAVMSFLKCVLGSERRFSGRSTSFLNHGGPVFVLSFCSPMNSLWSWKNPSLKHTNTTVSFLNVLKGVCSVNSINCLLCGTKRKMDNSVTVNLKDKCIFLWLYIFVFMGS